MHPRSSPEDSLLISALRTLEKKSPKLVKSHLYSAPSEPNISVCSWKLNEFKYYDIPSPFPTLARGLFSTEISSEGEKDAQHRIVIRGYDKFFNIGEVPWTSWEALETHTAPPYTLSLKSNGCIIFIGALTPKKLVITSKHSVGPVAGVPTSHAEAGEQWLRQYLEQKQKTEADLAGRLWEENWTAVAELCDDSFEEHVLPYSPEKTGLHLHGLNVSTKAFVTMPHETVDAFADEWGFIKTRTHTVNSIAEVREFTSHVADVGEWEGEAVEGFVVRTRVTEPPTEGRGGGKQASQGQSPYSPGSSFFFKVKFDEPYMMYRDWREATKKLLSTKGPMTPAVIPKSKMKRKETRIYVKWVIEEIKKNRKAFDGYTKGHGIIATRERFLEWYSAQKQKGGLKEDEDAVDKGENIQKAIIVPVAVPGCGKTSVAVALKHLFGFGHTQSDDIVARKSASLFINNVTELLQYRNVVIADKNNHLATHRDQLREAVAGHSPPVHLIGLNWSLDDKPAATVHRVCADRIIARGQNHQTLTADASDRRAHEDVIWEFINRHEELGEQEVGASIDLELEDDLEKMVRDAVRGLWKILGGSGGLLGEEEPSDEKIAEALENVAEYKAQRPSGQQARGGKAAQKATEKTPRYFGILPEVDVTKLLDGEFVGGVEGDEKTKDGAEFYERLKKAKRVTTRPHITIVHKNELPEEQGVWDRAAVIHTLFPPPIFKFTLKMVLWDGRVMVLPVESLEYASGPAEEAEKFLETLPDKTRNRLHITVGTADGSISAVEGKFLVEKWRAAKKDVFAVELAEEVIVTGRLKGLFS